MMLTISQIQLISIVYCLYVYRVGSDADGRYRKTPDSGAGVHKFNSCHPDQQIQGVTTNVVAPFLYV